MFYRTDTDEARLRNAYLKKLKNKEPSLFNEESTQLKRTETKQPFHFRHYKIYRRRDRWSRWEVAFLPIFGTLHDSNSLCFRDWLLSKLYFTATVEDEEALITDEDGRTQCRLWLADNEGLEETSCLRDWLLIFLLSPSWILSNETCPTFVSFRLVGRTQLQKKPSRASLLTHRGIDFPVILTQTSLQKWLQFFCIRWYVFPAYSWASFSINSRTSFGPSSVDPM